MRAAVLLLLALVAAGCGEQPSSFGPEAGGIDPVAALGSGDTSGYKRAIEVREFEFPQDHGPHQGYRTEWWYFTGNLEGESGRRFGFQLTFFRNALTPDMDAADARDTEWAATHLFMAHLAIGDKQAGRFVAHERFSREAAGLAGAQAAPFKVWLEDWRAEGIESGRAFPMRLVAAEGEDGIDLELRALKPPALQGDRGLSPKGPEPGNASYYYTMSRLAAEGAITLDGERFEVGGLAWMDREWSTSVLGEGQIGWDWFAIQLDDGRDIMAFQLRREDGRRNPQDAGLIVEADGSFRALSADEFTLTPTRTWQEYPVAWRIEIPGEELTLDAEALLDDSELQVSVRYWEGAIRLSGSSAGAPVSGRGFLEMTGYVSAMQGAVR